MSSTYSTSLRIELQGSGENSGTWGTITNNNFSQSLEFSIAGVTNVACGDAAVTTLTNADGPQSQANNQARNAHIRLTGCLLYTSPSPRDGLLSRMPSSA